MVIIFVIYYFSISIKEEEEEGKSDQVELGDFKIKLAVTKPDSTKRTFNLNFRPTTSVLNVKLDVSQLSDIPVSRQKWIGWPEGTTDDLTLAQIGIPRQHELHLSALQRSSGQDVSIIDKLVFIQFYLY